MSKNIWIAVAVLVIIGAGAFAYSEYGPDTQNTEVGPPMGGGKLDGNPTNFSREGIVTAEPIGPGQPDLFFSYADDNGASSSVRLVFDPISFCGGRDGYLECVAMSVTLDVPFGGKRAIVEGVLKQSTEGESEILVRKLRRLEEGEPALLAGPGSVFVSWPQAQDLIRSCAPTSLMQTHGHDVYLDMKGGGSLRTVEPVLDDVFRVAREAEAECGSIPLATE